MPQLVAVKFRYNPKRLWFDPMDTVYQTGDHVLVDTERGREVGLVVDANVNATDEQVAELKSPLKPVIRVLTELDFDHVDALDQKGKDALPLYRELVEKHGLDMKPIEVEYLFSGDRAVFFFSSDERVDFRELVRDLSSHFHLRVDMRQIGARDQARMIGGLAHCGEELCCTRFGGDFQPVSIRMAKEQDLPLNPAKISGACGRLMCCLRYEYEAYKDFKTRAPKKGTLVNTPLGTSKIIGFDTPREMLQLRLEDGKTINVPLAEMVCEKDKQGCSQCSVSRETIDRCASSSMLLALSALDRELEHLEDKLDSDVKHEAPQRSKQSTKERTRRRRSSGGGGGGNGGGNSSGNVGGEPRSANQLGSDSQATDTSESQDKSQVRSQNRTQAKPRPGQRSSGLRKRRSRNANPESAKNSEASKNSETPKSTAQNRTPQHSRSTESSKGDNNSGRRRRRRSTGGSNSSNSSNNGNTASTNKDNNSGSNNAK
jgi:cell fate regulator YaaT (PSP1 superfamily)